MNKNTLLKSILMLSIYCVGIGFGAILINTYYPDSQGFNRTIIFPRDNENPYYIFDDEIYTSKNEYSSIYFHGLGIRTIGDQSVSWQIDDVVVNITILTPSVIINPVDGYVYEYAEAYRNRYGVQIQPLERGSTRVISVMSSYNSSLYTNNPFKFEEESLAIDPEGNVKAWKLNDYDYFIYPTKGTSKVISQGSNQKIPITIDAVDVFDITTITHRLFFRLNSSLIPTEIYSHGTYLSYNSSIYGDGNNLESLVYDHSGYSLIVTSDDELAILEKQKTVGTAPPDLTGLTHPYLYFRESQKIEIESRINGTIPGPWQSWYNNIGSWSSLVDQSFKAYMEEDIVKINELIPQILDIASLEPFRQNLERGTAPESYILAYDLLYNYMTPEQQVFFEAEAYRITYPSADSIINNVCPNNNHRLVTLCSYGLLGLVMKNQNMIQLMQDQIDRYLSTHILRGGACFEGPSYADYTFAHTNLFMYALKQLGGYNYFVDSNYIDFLNNTVQTRSPDGTAALFEDAHDYANLHRIWLTSVNQIEARYPELASNMFWDIEQKGVLNIWAGHLYNNIILFNATGTSIKPQTPLNGSYIYFDSGLAGLGTGQDSNDTILMITNKPYYQSHAHYDENSFEYWAFGKKMLSNAGYPNYGSAGHSYSLSTYANNVIDVAGVGQYLIESDGFDAFVQSSSVQIIESPTFLPYEHALSFSHFPWTTIFISLGILVISLVYLTVYPESKHNTIETNRIVKKVGEVFERKRFFTNIPEKTYIRSLNIIQFAGFMMVFYQSAPYILKGIEHMETWPSTKALLSNIVWIVLGGLSVIVLFIVIIRNKYRIKREGLLSNPQKPRSDEGFPQIENRINLTNRSSDANKINMSRFSNLLFYIVWFILSITIIYMSFHLLQFNLFTEGSTVQNFMTQFKSSAEIFWSGWLIIVIFRYLTFVIFSQPRSALKSKIIHDIIRFSIFSIVLGFGIFTLQHIGIELINNLGIS